MVSTPAFILVTYIQFKSIYVAVFLYSVRLYALADVMIDVMIVREELGKYMHTVGLILAQIPFPHRSSLFIYNVREVWCTSRPLRATGRS